jgi:hypothetical protein
MRSGRMRSEEYGRSKGDERRWLRIKRIRKTNFTAVASAGMSVSGCTSISRIGAFWLCSM